MGLFDSVYAGCPTCGERVEFQSKEGECYMNSYTPDDAPANVLIDVLNAPKYCRRCGSWMALVDPAYPPGNPPRPSPKAVRLRDPEPHEVKIHSSQTFLRWWEPPFSFDDIRDSDGNPEGEKPQA